MDFFKRLFDTSDFPPRWTCGAGWEETPWYGWLHIFSDLGIWSAYLAIPLVLIYFLLRRKDLPFRRIFLLFGAFILACGTTHLMEAIIFWWPAYRLAGLIKLFTAVVSWTTVLALFKVVPLAMTLRSPKELEREIEARKNAEQALQRANDELEQRILDRTAELNSTNRILQNERERFRITLASIGDAVIATDTDGKVTFLNPVAEALTAWSSNEARGQPLSTVFQVVDEHTRQPVDSPVASVLREGQIVGMANHTVLVAKSGRELPIDDSAAPIRDEQGAFLGVVLVFRDVMEKRQAENELRSSEEKLRLLADTMPQLAWMSQPDGHCFWYNRRWYEYTGTSPEQVQGWGWQSVHDPAELPKVVRRWQESLATGEPFEMTFPLRGADGQFRSFLTRIMPLRGKDGSVIQWFGTNTNITEQVQLETALRESEAHLRASEARHRFLGDVSAALVGSLHYQDNLRQVAELAVPSLGDLCFFDVARPDDQLERVGWKHVDPAKAELAQQVRRFVPERDAEENPISKVLRTGRPELVTDVSDQWLQSISLSGEHLEFLRSLNICSVLSVPISVGQRRLGAMSFAYSVSGRRHTQEELELATEIARRVALMIENSKLFGQLQDADRKKNEFLAVLAHELRNPLSPISNALELMRITGGKADDIAPLHEMMERQVRQMTHLVDDLLDVSRITSGKIALRKERLDLAEVVASAVETSRPLIAAARHELTVTLPPQPLHVDADKTRLAQVLSNLLANAAKYTPEGGRIWLSVSRDGRKAVVRVRDTGMGIPAEMQPLIFEMFTQVDRNLGRSQGGLGIGLTLVRSFLDMHGGTIEAFSDGPGNGSEFVVRLPLAPDENRTDGAPGTQDSEPAAKKPSDRRRVLVVDDNKDSAETLGQLLEALGNEVQIAHDGPSALQAAAMFRPQVVLLDIGLPGISGYEVARRMRQMPEVRDAMLVAQTGWGQDEDKRQSEEAGFNAHLIKPVDTAELRRLLAGLNARPD